MNFFARPRHPHVRQLATDLSPRIEKRSALRLSGAAPFAVKIQTVTQMEEQSELMLTHEVLVPEVRDQMIIKLYIGGYSQDIETLKYGRIIGSLWARAFSAVLQHAAIPGLRDNRPRRVNNLSSLGTDRVVDDNSSLLR